MESLCRHQCRCRGILAGWDDRDDTGLYRQSTSIVSILALLLWHSLQIAAHGLFCLLFLGLLLLRWLCWRAWVLRPRQGRGFFFAFTNAPKPSPTSLGVLPIQPSKGEDPVCAICWDPIQERAGCLTRCAHAFHTNCLQEWHRQNPSCPLCREPVSFG